MKSHKLTYYILFFTFVLKCLLSYALPVAGDEAYYWVWGKNLQLSYYDHPGMVAWLASLTQYIPVIPEWFSLRVIFSFVSTLTFAVWFKIYFLSKTEHPDKKPILLFAFFFFSNPLIGIGGFLVTPDVPLLLFWALSFWSVLKILIHQQKKYYALLGIFLGLGFCSKYHIVFFPLTLLIGLILTKKIKLIKFKYVPLTFIFGLIFSSPVLIWNIKNDFASFKFQLNHGLSSIYDYQLWWTYTYLLGQVFIFNPFLFINLIKSKKSVANVSAYSQWLFFLYSSFKAKVEANWPVGSHAMALIDVDYKHKKTILLALVYCCALYLGGLFFYFSPKFKNKSLVLPTSDAVNLFYSDIKDLNPVYGPTYQLSSLINLMTGKQVYKLRDLSRFDFYDTLSESKPSQEKYYVLKYDLTEWPINSDHIKKNVLKDYPELKMKLYEMRNE